MAIKLTCSVCGKEGNPDNYHFEAVMTKLGPLPVLVAEPKATIYPVVLSNPEKRKIMDAVCNSDFCKAEISRITGIPDVYNFDGNGLEVVVPADRSKDN